MIYPSNIEEKLGFNQIRETLKNECLSSLGQAYVDKMRFSNDFALINKLISQTAEFKIILQSQVLFPSSNYTDVSPFLTHANVPGAFLDAQTFQDIKLSLRTITRILEFFDEAEEFPYLKELRAGIQLEHKIYRQLDRIIDDKGLVRDNASSEIQDIRRKLIQGQLNARREMDKILRAVKRDGFAQEDVEVTIRNGRLVIPIIAEYKRKVKGFIHDESATGQTVFLEPAQVLEINNEIKELEYQEKRELIKILTELTDYIRGFIPELKKAYTFLGLIDFVRSKAKFALQVEGIKPEMVQQTAITWMGARHPLLLLSLQKQGKTIVPLSIQLDQQKRILVISGPNAGGKSVCLKTIGLLQYMFQCGLLVSVAEGSTMGFFQDIFIDIGDEQSIENDLSTYSSHLQNMKHFINFAAKKSLILIDEFGTGTEPQFGAAIAESVLEKLNSLKVFGVITTHYANLKAFADKTDGIINGAMRFDMENLEPLYQLEMGKPGSSFALEIAKKIGLPAEIIEKSKEKLGTAQVDFEKLLKELEIERTKLYQTNERIASKEKDLNKTISEYSSLKDNLDNNKKTLLNAAKEQSKQLLRDANQKIEQTIRDIKENKADKEITKLLREDLEDFKVSLKEEKVAEKNVTLEPGEIQVGDYARIKESGAVAEVISIKGKDAEILIGELKSSVKLSRLEKLNRKEYRKSLGKEVLQGNKGININEKMAAFSPNIDLRGKRGEEALSEVDNLIDNAIMLGAPELKIIHGKGDGILRTLIRNHLKSYKQILSVTDEHADRGGAGVTIIHLKA